MFNEFVIENINPKLKKDISKKEQSEKKLLNDSTDLVLVNNIKDIPKETGKKEEIKSLENQALIIPKDKEKIKTETLKNTKIISSLKEQINKLKKYQVSNSSIEEEEKAEKFSLVKKLKNQINTNNYGNIKNRQKLKFHIPIEKDIYNSSFYNYKYKKNVNESINDESSLKTDSLSKNENWSCQLSKKDFFYIKQLFLFFDRMFVHLPEKNIDELFSSNLYKHYIKILNILRSNSN